MFSPVQDSGWKFWRPLHGLRGLLSQAVRGAAEGGGEERPGGADEEEVGHRQPQHQTSAVVLRHSRCVHKVPLSSSSASVENLFLYTSVRLLCSSTASPTVNIGQLEQQLILSLDPRKIRQILIELHGMAERPFWKVNSKVEKLGKTMMSWCFTSVLILALIILLLLFFFSVGGPSRLHQCDPEY